MRQLIRLAAGVYPRTWQDRYGAEFEALIEDLNPSMGTALNVLIGGLSMQIQSWSMWRVLAASAVCGALAVGGFWAASPKRYTSEAVLRVEDSSGGGGIKAVVENALSPAALSKVIAKEDLYERERSKTPGTDVTGLMRKSVRVEPLPAASGAQVAFSVAFDYVVPGTAQRVVNDLASDLIEENLRTATSSDRPSMRLQLLDPASLPGHAVRDGRGPIALGLSLGALMFGILTGFKRRVAR